MPKSRGTTLIPRIKYLRTRGVWEEVLEAVKPETREVIGGSVLASSWYPFDVMVDLIRTADRVVGRDDLDLARDMGRYAAAANLSTVFRFLIRFATPTIVLGKGAQLWSLQHDTGRARAFSEIACSASFEVVDFAAPDRALCASLEGWMERALELTGAKHPTVHEEICATKKGNMCRFRGTWNE